MVRKIILLGLLVSLVGSSVACNFSALSPAPSPTPAPTDSGIQPTPELPSEFNPPTEEITPAESPVTGETPVSSVGERRLTVAASGFLVSSGLLQELAWRFRRQSNYQVRLEVGGAGRAFRLGEKYVADVLLVNEPGSAIEFVQKGYGLGRYRVFYTDFVIVGPADDPAGVKGLTKAVEALKKIAAAQANFVTRSGDSDITRLEKRLWGYAGLTPSGNWYIVASDAGTAGALKLAAYRKAYMLVDRPTFLKEAKEKKLELVILVEGDPALFDMYYLIPVNPQGSPKINAAGSQALLDFLSSPEIQEIIRQFGVDTYGQQVFFPVEVKKEED